MNAKPQRFRAIGDENVPPPSLHQTHKVIHQRNKSSPALSMAAQNNAGRRAFVDVSNTKDISRASRDDSGVSGKPALMEVRGPGLSQPAQRRMTLSGTKGPVENATTTKPMIHAGKAPLTYKSKRNNAIYKDQLHTVPEKVPSKETTKDTEAKASHKGAEKGRHANNIVAEPSHGLNVDIASLVESDATVSETEDMKEHAHAKELVPAVSEPEEWDGDDTEYHVAPTYFSRGDNTDGTTTVIYPFMNNVTTREMFRAKDIVKSEQVQEDIDEEWLDTTMVAEYGDEIFLHLRKKEIEMLPVPDYMARQSELQWSMRSVLMDWLVQVHQRFNLLPETLFLTVNYIDRFLSYKVVSMGKLQLVGATAIFIAAKFEEITAPSVQEIVYMVDSGYSVDEILKAERFMLTILDFDLGWPGPMSFLRRISKADEYDLETRTVAKYFLELAIMDERFVCTPPSFIAAGAHCLSRLLLNKGNWTPAHAFYSGYLYSQLIPVLSTLIECCENPRRHHAAIFEKYSDRRFKRASMFVEAELAMDFVLPEASALNDPDRLDGYANY
ncbi:G2/mitotic-specific cyclin (Clb3), putative [Penicillium digitatum]|uniref:G2/mitotic-specific cyclin (Clb3), putative n=3 Tax=Penicillium digitatum TaxID=36651 RepID=K9G324_PEND2|nr:G2/mitotic-specific cyclin (Clb3), putative [Penicillium digitatum Pd1]EKV06206.1 G2/mitotic-specific cyclin (Clb3), putative [Penicillium digitatum Pd1]EKV07686.1 G2/mitotic-specific cyclin (Clb3), putative [Penicillium digitatum PHI26]QQK40572.1 G2/mitotic-specific cyclin (Clb3), putative [Penicillium digitatum]